MRIIPLSELRNTSAASKLVTESEEPVFVTKQGGEHIVMLSHEMYEDLKKENRELRLYVKVLNAELEQLKNGNQSRSFDDFIEELKMKIEIIPAAENDIRDIYHHIRFKLHNPKAAADFVTGIREHVSTLKSLPERGTPYGRKYRKISFKQYRIVYEISEDTVYIIAVE